MNELQPIDQITRPNTPVLQVATSHRVRSYCIFLLNGFDLQAFAGCVEALQIANTTSGHLHYVWTIVSESTIARSRSEISLPALSFTDVDTTFDRLVVTAGASAAEYSNRDVLAWLRRQARRGASLCALEGGIWLLAKAGLAHDRRVVAPWHLQAALQERFELMDITTERFLLDADISSSVGGVATFEMMVEWIRQDHGDELADAVAKRQAVTSPSTHGRAALRLAERLRIRNSHIAACLNLMEGHIDTPLGKGELAANVGLSTRHLERLFRRLLKTTPHKFYLRLRLERARELVQQTKLTILEIAIATGFTTASHFSRSFKDTFGQSPRSIRNHWCHSIQSGALHRLL